MASKRITKPNPSVLEKRDTLFQILLNRLKPFDTLTGYDKRKRYWVVKCICRNSKKPYYSVYINNEQVYPYNGSEWTSDKNKLYQFLLDTAPMSLRHVPDGCLNESGMPFDE